MFGEPRRMQEAEKINADLLDRLCANQMASPGRGRFVKKCVKSNVEGRLRTETGCARRPAGSEVVVEDALGATSSARGSRGVAAPAAKALPKGEAPAARAT